MAEKILKTKIALLYKSISEWNEIATSYIPLKGEVCFCEIPASTGVVANEPCILFKVGDGVKNFSELPWASATAVDVYAWAKKANLDFSDLNQTFLDSLDARIIERANGYMYQMVAAEDGIWKLQKRKNETEAWVDVSTVNVAQFLNKKVDKEVISDNGKAIIFNEADGGGAKFEHEDGTWSFAGVNDGGKDGLAGQVYAVDSTAGYKGAKLDVQTKGIFYTKGEESLNPYSERDVAANEIAVKGDIAEYSMVKDADPGEYASVYHLTKDGTNIGAAIEIAKDQLLKSVTVKTCTEKDVPISGLNVGDKYIDFEFETTSGTTHSYIAVKDMVQPYSAGTGIEIDSDNKINVSAAYQTEIAKIASKAEQADLETEVSAREAADTAEATAREAADTALSDRIDDLEQAKDVEQFDVTDGGKTYRHVYANGIALKIEDNATENIGYYNTADGVGKTIAIPYGAIVHGGGYAPTADKVANFESSLVVVNGGKLRGVYGGSRGYGSVGNATVIINGGTFNEGAYGGGAAGHGEINNVGIANVKFNGGTTYFNNGGGMGHATVGKVNLEINGGTHPWMTAGGANGYVGIADVKINGGTMTCFQTVNRGIIQEANVEINGGTITNVYAGGETTDSTVTGKCEKAVLKIWTSFDGHLNKGTYGGVEDASRCSGEYNVGELSDVEIAEAIACNLTEATQLILNCNL